MTDITAIRVGMAAGLATIPGLRAFAFAPDQINPPCAVVWPARGDFSDSATFDGADDVQLVVSVLVAKATDRGSQNLLDPYLSDGPQSIEAAVSADQTLGGACSFIASNHISNYGLVTWEGVEYLGAEMSFTVGT